MAASTGARGRVAVVLAAILLLGAQAPREARGELMGVPLLGPVDLEDGFFAEFGVFAGHPTNSYTRVRENADKGTNLWLEDDLGVPVIGEAGLQLGWRFDADDALALACDYIFIGGGAVLHGPIVFNATTLAAGTDVQETPLSVHWVTVELQFERTIFRFAEKDRGLLAIDLGIRYDDIDWRFSKATISSKSTGAEAGEDFRTQSIPIPVIGLTARFPVVPDWDLAAGARGFTINHMSSGRSEGGIVYISESFIELTVGAVYMGWKGVQLGFGYRFLYVDFDGESREDGNQIGVFTHGAYLTVQVTF